MVAAAAAEDLLVGQQRARLLRLEIEDSQRVAILDVRDLLAVRRVARLRVLPRVRDERRLLQQGGRVEVRLSSRAFVAS